jgi:hypothetical protein
VIGECYNIGVTPDGFSKEFTNCAPPIPVQVSTQGHINAVFNVLGILGTPDVSPAKQQLIDCMVARCYLFLYNSNQMVYRIPLHFSSLANGPDSPSISASTTRDLITNEYVQVTVHHWPTHLPVLLLECYNPSINQKDASLNCQSQQALSMNLVHFAKAATDTYALPMNRDNSLFNCGYFKPKCALVAVAGYETETISNIIPIEFGYGHPFAAPPVRLSQSVGLHSRQTIQVSGSDWEPGYTAGVRECQFVHGICHPLPLFPPTHTAPLVQPNGTFHTSVQVQDINPTTHRDICTPATPCGIEVTMTWNAVPTPPDPSYFTKVPISFK